MEKEKIVRIGGASGALVDSLTAVPQLLGVAGLDYLVFDYLAEGSMGIFARQRVSGGDGFARDFADEVLGPYLRELKKRRIRVVSNAGGLNPEGLAALLREKAAALGIALRVGVVSGDDVLDNLPELAGQRDMFTGVPLPARATSANAYLGAFPVAAALDAGADIVVTGRIVDSALVLGPLIHAFGWHADDYDRLAAGTVAGHLLECGTQVTGGTFTDWQEVPGWANIGFPVGECHADGSVVITKPAGTGGLVSTGTVAEQLLYEVGDPQAYLMPDVVADFSTVTLAEVGENRVEVKGATGYPPTAFYKVCATFDAGWRSVMLQPIAGLEVQAKAERQGAAILARVEQLLAERGFPPFRQVFQDIIVEKEAVPPRAVLKLVVDHADPRPPRLFWREQNAAIMNMAVGTSIPLLLAAAPVFPLTGLSMFLVPKTLVAPQVTVEGEDAGPLPASLSPPLSPPLSAVAGGFREDMLVRPGMPMLAGEAGGEVDLLALAFVRSGEKGDLFNVGVVARKPEYLPWLAQALTPECLAACYRDDFDDPEKREVKRYLVPGIHALNFVVLGAQGGGITLSPRFDAAAKSMGQKLLASVRVPVPAALAKELGGRIYG